MSQINNLLHRVGRVRAAIGPAGPVAAQVLMRGGHEHLCLSTWRGKKEASTAVIFAKCPTNASLGRPTTGNLKGSHMRRWQDQPTAEWLAEPVSAAAAGRNGSFVRFVLEHLRFLVRAAPNEMLLFCRSS